MSELELEPELLDAEADAFAQRMADTIVRAVDLGVLMIDDISQVFLRLDDGRWIRVHQLVEDAVLIELKEPDSRLRIDEHGKVVRA